MSSCRPCSAARRAPRTSPPQCRAGGGRARHVLEPLGEVLRRHALEKRRERARAVLPHLGVAVLDAGGEVGEEGGGVGDERAAVDDEGANVAHDERRAALELQAALLERAGEGKRAPGP